MAKKRGYTGQDDQPLTVVKRDVGGGMNTRQFEQIIADNQAVLLQNILLETAGSRQLRSGQTRIDNTYPGSSASGYGLFGFDPDGGQFELMAVQGGTLSGWIESGSFVSRKTGLTDLVQTTMIKAGQSGQGDILLLSNGTDNVFSMYQDHTVTDLGNTNTSPPLTTAITYYGNRVWGLLANLLYFSDAFPSDYSTAFDRTTNAFRLPVGTARALIATRDQGIVALGADQIWQLAPSAVPDPTTDFPSKILDIGCVAGNTAVQVADDIIFMAPDGVRGLFRTQLDKLQAGQSFPLSYQLADQFNSINWNHIDKACAVYFDNKYIIALPTNGASYNNACWVYYPALSTSFYASTNVSNMATSKSWVVYEGWNIARFSKLRINGLETLYGIDAVTGEVFQLFSGRDDNGTAIIYDEQSKAEDFGQPLVNKKGCELKIRVKGGSGTLVVYASADGSDWIQLGTINLALTTITFPTGFPVVFGDSNETFATFHLDNAGILEFKRCKIRIYCNTLDALITILETSLLAFPEPYLSEG